MLFWTLDRQLGQQFEPFCCEIYNNNRVGVKNKKCKDKLETLETGFVLAEETAFSKEKVLPIF